MWSWRVVRLCACVVAAKDACRRCVGHFKAPNPLHSVRFTSPSCALSASSALLAASEAAAKSLYNRYVDKDVGIGCLCNSMEFPLP